MNKMKAIYRYIFCAVALISLPVAAIAQDDKGVSREMTLEREYDPSVQDANKVNTLPVVKEPEISKRSIEYSTFASPANPGRELGLLPPGNVMTDMLYNQRRGYLNFGAGSHLNINGDLGYHILSTNKDQLNIFFTHRSTNGNIKFIQENADGAKTKAKLNDNLGGLNYRHVFDNLAFKIGANYNYTGFNYFGLLPEYFPIIEPYPVIDTEGNYKAEPNQVNQAINGYVGIESKENAPVGYLLDLDYTHFGQKYGYSEDVDGVAENNIKVAYGLNAGFGGSQKVGIEGDVHYFKYSFSDMPDFDDNHFIGTLSPYYKVEGDNWNIKLGAKASFITNEDKKFVASPNIAMDVTTGGRTTLYLTAGGGPETNSFYDMSRRNRYVMTYITPATSRTWLDAMLGVKSGVVPGFWFDIFAGYKITDDDCFFNPASRGFGNGITAISLDSKRLQAGASFKYAYQKLFEITLKGVYNNWDVDDIDYSTIPPESSFWDPNSMETIEGKAYGRPEMELTAGFMLRPIDPLQINIDYYLATGRYALYNFNELKMKNINELNIRAAYDINDTFGLYVSANNVLFQKYEMNYGYPMQRFGIMGGININF